MRKGEQTVSHVKNVFFVIFMNIRVGFRLLAMRLNYGSSGFANLHIVNRDYRQV